MARYVMESGIRIRNRRPEWVVVEEDDEPKVGGAGLAVAHRRLIARALSMQALYEPHGGRQLRVREVKP